MAAKIISQRKWAKLVASTGALSQPPGALTRLSNLFYTQRGSLQIADGSHSIGQIPTPWTNPAFIALFTKYASGQYPIYAALVNPNGYILPDFTSFTAAPSGSATNAAGTYYFAIVALGTVNGVNVSTAAFLTSFTTASAFDTVNFTWPVIANATGYDIYYLDSATATAGNKILSNVTGTPSGGNLIDSFTGALTTGATALPQTNTSYLLQYVIGSVTPPSPIVIFVPVVSGIFPATLPQPAQLAPGDPDFIFDTISSLVQTYSPGSNGGTASISVPYGSPMTTDATVASTWASESISSLQTVTLSFTASGTVSLIGFGKSIIIYQYSVDGGAGWNTFHTRTVAANFSWTDNIKYALPPGNPADLNTLELRVHIIATCSSPGGENDTDVTVDPDVLATTTTYSSFSPYGGIPDQVCSIPELVQFAGQEILILGNGYAPQSSDPTQLAAATPSALTNTFTAAYPTWQAGVDWVTGAQLTASGFVFTAQQGGVSGSTTPSWDTTIGSLTGDGSVLWVCTATVTDIPAPRGAAHGIVYAGSLWLANTSPATTSDQLDGPTCLKMSDSNNPNSWNPVNTAFIGRDDGSQITGLQAFTIAALGISPTGSMCVFKEFQTYQVIGVFGSASFEIQPAQTNLGCVAARSIQFIPGFGVVRFSHLGFAVFDGINDRLISEDIRPYLFGGVDSESDLIPVDPTYIYLSQSAQTIKPPMYFCAMPLSGNSGILTRLFCYDLVMKAWAVLDLPWAISSLNAVAAGEGYPLVVAGKTDGTVQRVQAGDVNWDQDAADQSSVQWGFRSPDVFGEGSSQRLFYEMATIRGYGNSTMVASILASLWLDGKNVGAQAVDIVPQGGGNLFEVRVKIFKTGYRAHLDVSGGGGGAGGVIDAIDWAVSPKSSLARRIIG